MQHVVSGAWLVISYDLLGHLDSFSYYFCVCHFGINKTVGTDADTLYTSGKIYMARETKLYAQMS